jgi:hypothetical protein
MPLFLVMLTVMYALPVASTGVVVNPPAFAQSSSLAQDIIDSAQQESSSSAANDNVLEDDNEFGDDATLVDQDSIADQDSANLGLQDQDATQDQEATQEDLDEQVGEAVQQSQQQQPSPPPPPPPEEDTTPPTLTVPEDIVVQATSTEGAQVTFRVTAEDNVDGTATLDEENTLTQDDVGGDIIISCDPPSGSEFPVGETVVECTATDAAGNTATASFTVTVQDTTPPTLTVPEDITREATSSDGAVVAFEVTAQDNVDGTATLDENNMLTQDDVGGDITISCTPQSGSTFSIGTTTVNCEATDAAGNTARNSFTVTVNAASDTTAPVITVPEDIVVGGEDPNTVVVDINTGAAQVTFRVTAEDNVDGTATLDEENTLTQDDVGGDIIISCDPPSGSIFQLDVTEVVCTATDEAGNTATASFTVNNKRIMCQGQPANVIGTPGNDHLVGTNFIDGIAGFGGDDTIEGLGAPDKICGHAGDDVIDGGNDSDGMFGGDGNDIIRDAHGGKGDVMEGDAGDDTLIAGPGHRDFLRGGAGNDNLNSVDGVVDNDDLDGGDGTDTCTSDPDPEVNCELD